jgi:hypothetical protein
MGRYDDAGSDTGRAALLIALMQQTSQHERQVKEKGGPAAFLTEWMGKHPDPTKVGDFVENLLCVPSSQVRQLLDAGEALPDGFKEWRQKCYDTYRATVPIGEWKQLAKHPELVPSAKDLRAAKNDPEKLAELKMKVWGASLVISDWALCGILNIDTDTKDLYPKGRGIYWELFESDRTVRDFTARLKEARKEAGEVPVHGQEIYQAHDVKKALLAQMRGEIEAAAREQSGSEGYGQGYGGAEVRQGRSTPGLLTVRLKD